MAGGDGAAGPGARRGWRWDVALSFADAQRNYVEQVAAALKERGLRCFYDADEQIGLWGKYLAEELPAIYGEQAAAVVVFISAEYAAQDWTRLERRAALGRAVRERGEYVLPARFDDTPLPGLLSDMVTVDLRGRAPEQFAEMIADKLVGLDIAAPAPSVAPLAGPVDLVLAVTADQVRLAGGRRRMCPRGTAGCGPGLAEAVNETRRARAGSACRSATGRRPRRRPGSCRWAGPAGCWASRSCPGRSPASWRGCWRRRSGRISRCGSAWRCRRSWPGCRGRRCPAPMAAARWRCTRWSAVYRKTDAAAGRRAAGAAADRGGDRRPRHRRRAGAGL